MDTLTFIQKKAMMVLYGIVACIMLCGIVALSISWGLDFLQDNFALSAMLIGVAPFVHFATAKVYRAIVVVPVRQLSVIHDTNTPQPVPSIHYVEVIIRTAQSVGEFVQWIPFGIALGVMVMSVILVPSTLGVAALASNELTTQLIAGCVISANLLLFVRVGSRLPRDYLIAKSY